MTETFNDINLNIKINDILFTIKKIIIDDNSIPFNAFNRQITVTNPKEIKILAETANSNYIPFEKWFSAIRGHSATTYKKDINYNGFFIGGIFPIDYDFNQYSISVTFSADYMRGDIHLFKLQQLRKQKLKKILECQKSS